MNSEQTRSSNYESLLTDALSKPGVSDFMRLVNHVQAHQKSVGVASSPHNQSAPQDKPPYPHVAGQVILG